MDIKKAIRDANDFADEAIADTCGDLKSIEATTKRWMNAGTYNLQNKHLFGWFVVTVALCLVF